MDYNKVTLLGRLGRDPETKMVGSKKLVSFSVATSYGTGDKRKTDWHQVSVWEKLGDIAEKLLHKGDRVLIEGRISYNEVDKDGVKKTYTQIVASNLIAVDSRAEATGNTTTQTSSSAGPQVSEEDIPF